MHKPYIELTSTMLYKIEPPQKSLLDPPVAQQPNAPCTKIIDFFDARKNLIADAAESDRRYKLDEEIREIVRKQKRSVILADPIEDALLFILAAAVVVVLVLICGSS
jgi:hypothetical protein